MLAPSPEIAPSYAIGSGNGLANPPATGTSYNCVYRLSACRSERNSISFPSGDHPTAASAEG